MSRYRMDGGSVVDTENAIQSWKEGRAWNGNNHISTATGSQWDHQELHKSRKGRYYVERWSDWQDTLPGAEWVSNRAAAAWLLSNGHEVPEDLSAEADDVLE